MSKDMSKNMSKDVYKDLNNSHGLDIYSYKRSIRV